MNASSGMTVCTHALFRILPSTPTNSQKIRRRANSVAFVPRRYEPIVRPTPSRFSSIRFADDVRLYDTIQYNTKFVKRHVAVALEALANRTVKKHRRGEQMCFKSRFK